MTTKASTHIASCYQPNTDGVPAPTSIEIRRFRGRGQQYAVATLRGSVAESCEYRGTQESAIDLAASLGYTEVV